MSTRQEVEDLGLTREALAALAEIARTDGLRHMRDGGYTLSTAAADAIGARFWLERIIERLEAIEYLRGNAEVFGDDGPGFEDAERQVDTTVMSPMARAQGIVQVLRRQTFDPTLLG